MLQSMRKEGAGMQTGLNLKRISILNKCEGRCAYCGKELSLSSMTIDHIKSKDSGGGNNMKNLHPACRECNTKKTNMSLSEFRAVAAALYAAGKYELFFTVRSSLKFDFYYSHLRAERKRAASNILANAESVAKPADEAELVHEVEEVADLFSELTLDSYDDPYMVRESLFPEDYCTRALFDKDSVGEHRRDALLNRYCLDYDRNIFCVIWENYISEKPTYDFAKINDVDLLRLVAKLEEIPTVTPTTLLRIQNEYILGNIKPTETKGVKTFINLL
jgi:hypothetical protein